jgi:hypothetical protein
LNVSHPLVLQCGFSGKDGTQLGQCLLAPIAVTGNKRQGPCELRSVPFGVISNDAPHLDSSEHDTITSRDLTSYDEVLWFIAKGLEQIRSSANTFGHLVIASKQSLSRKNSTTTTHRQPPRKTTINLGRRAIDMRVVTSFNTVKTLCLKENIAVHGYAASGYFPLYSKVNTP